MEQISHSSQLITHELQASCNRASYVMSYQVLSILLTCHGIVLRAYLFDYLGLSREVFELLPMLNMVKQEWIWVDVVQLTTLNIIGSSVTPFLENHGMQRFLAVVKRIIG